MLNQESLYRLIFKEEWKTILDLLYKHRNDIATDPMLMQAAAVFEQEFFKKLQVYQIDKNGIVENLDTLFVLNHGKFYQLSESNYKSLILEIIKRKPLGEAADFAREFPEDESCKAVIENYEQLKKKQKIFSN